MDRNEFNKMLDIAIEREIESFEFYRQVAGLLTDKGLINIFNELADEEKGHRSLLEALKEDGKSHISFAAPKVDYRLAEQTELPRLSTNMKPADAFALAMKKEQQAAEFYQDLAARTDDAELKDMCLNLANMELQHKQKIENAYVDVGYPEVF